MIFLDTATIGFPFLDEIPNPPIRLTGTGVEFRNHPSYYFDNSNRNINSYVFQYTLEGFGYCEVNGQIHTVDKGKAFFIQIPSNTKYYYSDTNNIETNPGWKFLFVLFTGNGIHQYYEKIVSSRGNVFNLDINSPAMLSAIELFKNAKEGLLNSTILASSTAFDFLCKLCYFTNSYNTYSYRNRQVISFLEQHFSNISGISEAADFIGVSQCHLTRSFSKDVGISPLEYLTKIRLNHALDLLVNTNETLDEIAHKCGYDNGNYFGKIFKKYMNCTPMTYRLTRRL